MNIKYFFKSNTEWIYKLFQSVFTKSLPTIAQHEFQPHTLAYFEIQFGIRYSTLIQMS